MNRENPLEQIRQDVEARQKAIVFPDATRNGITIDAFLWKGDPKAKPIQRAGLIVFALFFLLMAVSFVCSAFKRDSNDGWAILLAIALLNFLLSMRLFRNAFLRPQKHSVNRKPVHSGDSLNQHLE